LEVSHVCRAISHIAKGGGKAGLLLKKPNKPEKFQDT